MQCYMYNQVVNLHCYLHTSIKQKPIYYYYSVLNIKNVSVAINNEYEAVPTKAQEYRHV